MHIQVVESHLIISYAVNARSLTANKLLLNHSPGFPLEKSKPYEENEST